MRSLRLALPTLMLFAAPAVALAAGDNIFAGTQVHTINIEFTQPDWWDSLTVYYEAGEEQYLAAAVTFNGVRYDRVGVRFKGNASYTHPNGKKPFRLSFDEFVPNQLVDGLKGIHLNNCWEDPSFLREKLHLDLARDVGIPAPRGNFAELYLNGELWGFYSLVEHVNKTLLSDRYGNSGGNLYKAVDGLLNPIVSDFRWYGADPSFYVNRYELKTDDSADPWTDLITVIDSLNHSASLETALPALVNMDALYRAIGTALLMSSLDSYAGSCRNFYVYFNQATGKMEWILWDEGMSLGSYWALTQNFETISVTYVSNAANRPLVGKIYSTPELLEPYLQTFCEIYTGYFSDTRLFPQIDRIADLVRPYVYADPRKMYTNEQFETNLDTDLIVGGHRKPGLKSFISARATSVESQLAALGVSCSGVIAPGDVVINEFAASNTLILDPAGEPEDWIEIYNNTDVPVSLAGMFLSDTAAEPTQWQFPSGTAIAPHGFLIVWADDDEGQAGLHASFKLSASGEHIRLSDGTAAVVDSVTFGPQTADLTMARIPNGTGPFVQGPPTFNARNDIGAGDVVINEFAASNTLILDPAGEAEDWIEMYNNTAREVDLGGMYLSDDAANPAKWQFPAGTTITAHGFLIIWADEDEGQEGLHAAFKLSASGEHLRFSDTQEAVLDSVTFGAQTADLTMARVPNGTGPFVQGTPTFNASNGIAPGHVVINEFAASNTLILDPAGEAEDWIEMYNNTDSPLDLSGMYLSDTAAQPTKWQFPEGTTIPAEGFLIIWADEDPGQEGLHATFKLSASGEQVWFSGIQAAVLDSVTYGPQTTDLTMARIPNGTGNWEQSEPTFNAHNGYGNTLAWHEVVINEFMATQDQLPDPAGEFEDWIELFNRTDGSVELDGLYLTDDPASPAKWQFPEGTTIPSGGYLLIWADEDTGQEGIHAGFKLSSGGESIRLSNQDLTPIDSTSFGPQTLNVSMARIPNGTGEFQVCTEPTPGAENPVGSESVDDPFPARVELAQNAPNPFSGRSTLAFSLVETGPVTLRIFDLQGRVVATLVDGVLKSGTHRVELDASRFSSGMYLGRLETGGVVATRRILVLK